MTTAKITSKGRITIPAPVRAALHIQAGDRVEFVEVQDGRYELIAVTHPVTKLKGMFGKFKEISIEDMNCAIAKRASSAR